MGKGVLHHAINTNGSHLTECECVISDLRNADVVSTGTFIGLMVYDDERLCRKCVIALLTSITRHAGELTEEERAAVEN